jgi:hypothetical protein
MDCPIIKKTNDYNIFKNLSFNKEKHKSHLNALKVCIEKENLLHLHPILVNHKMEVIDGQHRLEVARELGLDVYYIESQLSYNHIISSNSINKKISTKDIIKFWGLKDQIKDYLKLREWITETKASPQTLIALIFGPSFQKQLPLVKEGSFRMPEENKDETQKILHTYSVFFKFCKNRHIKPYAMFNTPSFGVAFRKLVQTPGFYQKNFMQKVENRWFDLVPQKSQEEWYKLLVSIYNWGKGPKIGSDASNSNKSIIQDDMFEENESYATSK